MSWRQCAKCKGQHAHVWHKRACSAQPVNADMCASAPKLRVVRLYSRLPLVWLQRAHATARLSNASMPLGDLGTMCSSDACAGSSCARGSASTHTLHFPATARTGASPARSTRPFASVGPTYLGRPAWLRAGSQHPGARWVKGLDLYVRLVEVGDTSSTPLCITKCHARFGAAALG